MEFKPFPKIERLEKAQISISQKLNGTNASVCIYEEDGEIKLKCGSRTRWIYPGDDNFGFAAFVDQHKEVFIEKLGLGHHFGEWVGPGINSGEGLTERKFVLFSWWKEFPHGLPPQTEVVPLLYNGKLDYKIIDEVMKDLKTNGSKFVEGFMRPEGIVINLAGKLYKNVFEAEETQWKQASKEPKVSKIQIDYAHLLQPIRLEKLLSRDEQYLKNYPNSLPDIARAYTQDLIDEGQITGDKDEVKAITKGAGKQIFKFIRDFVNEKGNI